MRLQREAPRVGGRVVVLVGNHEAMNMTDDLRYVSAADYAAFATADSARVREDAYQASRDRIEAAFRRQHGEMKADAIHAAWIAATPLGMVEHQRAWHAGGDIGRWVAAEPAVLLVDGTLFVHGGISARYAHMPLDQINAQVAAALRAGETASTSIINDMEGPLWYRGLVTRDAAIDPEAGKDGLSIEQEVDAVLRAYGASRIVVAHTPILSGIAVLDGGKLVRIDTGISAVFGGTVSYLEIVDGTLVPHAIARAP